MRLNRMHIQRRVHVAAFTASMCLAGSVVAQNEAVPVPKKDTKKQKGKIAKDNEAKKSRVLWKYAPNGSQFNDILAGVGVVFALDRSGKVHAIDGTTGKALWRSAGKEKFSYGFGLALSVQPDFDALFVGCDTGLFALDLKTGKKLWHTEIAAGVAGPACTKKAVIAGGADGQVYACELKTGKILWQHDYIADRPDDPPGFSSEHRVFAGKAARPGRAATDGKMVLFSVFDHCRTIAVDASSGRRLWDLRSKGWMSARPAIGPRSVYAGSQDRHLYAVDKVTGKLMWKFKTGSRVSGAARPTERFVYFGSCDANIYAVDQVVGGVKWKFKTEHKKGYGAPIYSRPLVIGDKVYLAAMRGKIYALNRHTGKLLWKLRPLAKSEPISDLFTNGARLFLSTRKSGKEGESAVLAIDAR